MTRFAMGETRRGKNAAVWRIEGASGSLHCGSYSRISSAMATLEEIFRDDIGKKTGYEAADRSCAASFFLGQPRIPVGTTLDDPAQNLKTIPA